VKFFICLTENPVPKPAFEPLLDEEAYSILKLFCVSKFSIVILISSYLFTQLFTQKCHNMKSSYVDHEKVYGHLDFHYIQTDISMFWRVYHKRR